MGPPKPPVKVNEGEYEVVKRLGAGCFGEVWRGRNIKTGDEVAMKFEFRESKSAPQLFREMDVIKSLRENCNPQGVVECFYFGKEGQFNCLVMEILGKSLEDHVQANGGKLSAKTTGLIAEQVLQRIEFFHSRKLVHRDIKPENFMFGVKDKIHHVYIIDFGLSKPYWGTGAHAAQKSGLSLTGTARYASINAHKGVEQSRRDDLEAIGHMFLYFLRGALPWSGLDAKTQEEKYRKICEKKEQTPLDILCKGFPNSFEKYLAYCRKLGFMEKPDYTMLYDLMRSVRTPGTEDHHYQWFESQCPMNGFQGHEKMSKDDTCKCPYNPGCRGKDKSQDTVALLVQVQPRSLQPQPDDKSSKKAGAPAGGNTSAGGTNGGGDKNGGSSKGCCVIS